MANARWATRGAGVSPHIQVCICYERGLRSWIRGAAFCRIHSKIDVPAELRDVLSETARATNDAEMDEVLNGWSVRLQRAEDARRLARIRQMQDALQRPNREK